MVDKRTGLKFSYFFQKNNDMIDPTFLQLRKFKQVVHPVRPLICNNYRDDFKLNQVENGKGWKIYINFECTGAGTPQRNYLA